MNKKIKRILRALTKALIIIFALIGFILTVGFLAQYFGWTKVPGAIDWRSRSFSPDTTNPQSPNSAWQNSEEWATLKKALAKDAPVIQKAARDAGVSPRLIATTIVSEQIRLFTSEREVFKQIFAPLSILGVQSQFSLGVTGIKYDTAERVEVNLQDSTSPFYLGSKFEHLLDFSSTTDQGNERLTRLADQHDHYYSYLYTGLYLRQVTVQWQRAGVYISHQPGVLATLFNLGFAKSQPKSNPAIGGAEIEVGGQKYTFGGLAQEFYDSNELLAELPR